MKLATLDNGTRDGRLVVVSKDLTRCCAAGYIAPTLQAALDDWERIAPELELLARDVEHETVPCERVPRNARRIRRCRAPINGPMAAPISTTSNWCVRRAGKVPDSFYHDPLMYQGGSDTFLPPRSPIPLGDPAWGWRHGGRDRGPSPMMCRWAFRRKTPQRTSSCWMLVNDVSLRGLNPGGIGKGLRLLPVKTRQCLFAGRRHA